jgi:undecaprenyl-diphosphatase
MGDTPTTTAAAPALDLVADGVSLASDFGVAWIALSAAQVALGTRSARSAIGRLTAAGVVSLVLTRLLKHFFGVPRDEAPSARLARTPTSSRFPSGHTLAAFTAAIVLPRSSRGRSVALLAACAVAWARVRIGHHRAGDVVAGAAAGLGGGAAVLAGCAALRRAGD